ncbi:FMN-binding protein [Hungatella hathewayi]|nr:FMN-binding protein [Hungatella hathewayi]CCZ61008.1 putative uncharacterized protein [Hungatella hathewayi CAG:224]
MNKGSLDTKKKGLIGLGALVVLAGATILGSDPLYKAIDDMARPAIYTAGTYTASARGYGGPVTVTVKVSTKAIESIDVVGEKETLLDQVVPSLPDAIIGKQTLDMDAVSGATLSSNAIIKAVEKALAEARGEAVEEETTKAEESAATGWNDGTYSYEAPEFDDNGYKDLVNMTIKDGKITALSWDCVDKDGKLKSQLSMDGQYVMTEDGPKWYEQADAVVKYVLENQSLDGLINEEGYTDTVSSVSINLYGFVNGVKDCLKQAAGEGKTQAGWNDGSYSYEAPEFDSNGYKDQVSMTVKGGRITALTWDCVDKDGKLKSQLSMDGQYVMTEDGPKWYEQADAVVKYVLENQSLDGLINEEGYTDTVSSVSINLYGFVNGVKDCLKQAAGEAKAQAGWNDGSYSYEAPEFDSNGYKDQVAMTIEGGRITALTWDCVDKDGKLKSNLSMNGEYVMTEDGPKWHEQADAVVKYVLANQSLDGLINADGYTDTVASVSINLYGFVNGVKDCLKQAAGEAKAQAGWNDGSYSYEAPEFDSNGYKDQVAMTIEGGRITALTWDCVDKDGKLKSNLSMNGEYVMTEDGPKWHEQAEAVVKYVLENQSLDHLIDADGYTDTVASVSINLYGFVNGVKDCLRQASEGTAAKSSWSDGTFSYEAPEFDSNGYKDQVSMTVKDGKMTALTWDCVDKEGKKKSNLSMDGEYVMTEDGPKWHEQADAVVKYVLENQSLDGLINEDGYTDTVASVSINLYGFVGGVEDCLRQSSEGSAAAASASAVKDGSYSYESPEFDGNGYKDQVSMTIKDGKITALTWDCVDKDGKKKSNLSMNGEYVMTEDGPKWHEQAESVVAYVLENQSLDGLINEDGYTDAIASVSINLYGFTGGVEDCLKQASR